MTQFNPKLAEMQAQSIDPKVVKALARIEARRNQVLGHIHQDLRRVAAQRAEVRNLDRQESAILEKAKAALVGAK